MSLLLTEPPLGRMDLGVAVAVEEPISCEAAGCGPAVGCWPDPFLRRILGPYRDRRPKLRLPESSKSPVSEAGSAPYGGTNDGSANRPGVQPTGTKLRPEDERDRERDVLAGGVEGLAGGVPDVQPAAAGGGTPPVPVGKTGESSSEKFTATWPWPVRSFGRVEIRRIAKKRSVPIYRAPIAQRGNRPEQGCNEYPRRSNER